MILDAKLITALFFIIINFAVLFFVKTKINKALSLTFSYLAMVLFLTMTVSSYNNLKETIVLLALYLAVVLFLIFNCDSFISQELQKSKFQKIQQAFFVIPVLVFSVLIIFFSTFWITKNISEISIFVEEKKIEVKNKELIASLKFSPNKITTDAIRGMTLPVAADIQAYKTPDEFNMNARKRAHLKDQLSESFLLKRSSDLILFIMILSVFPLLILRKKEI